MKQTTEDSNGKERTIIENNEYQNSIKVSRNAKGEFAWEIKVYADTSEEALEKATRFKRVALELAQ